MIIRTLRVVLVSAVTLAACVAAAEVGRRILDGYRVGHVALAENPDNTDLLSSDRRSAGTLSMEKLLGAIERDKEADLSWFDDRPQPISGTSPQWADRRRAAFDPEANYVWNAATLNDAGPQAFLYKNQARLDEILTFRAPDGGRHPLYRLYPGIQTGFGFTNQFGWRGRPIRREKPADVVRIGVLGDSTTAGYPGLLEHWLNMWSARRSLGVRFEVINAARPSTGALDAAAILDFELESVDVDYVILYGFGNGIYAADDLVTLPPGVERGKPPSDAGVFDAVAARISGMLEPAARWSAGARFLRSRLKGQRGGTSLPEPPKPSSRMAFPSGIDEKSPDPEQIAGHTGGGLMFLDAYVQALNHVDVIAKSRGIRLFVSTFRIMAFDGMRLSGADAGSGRLIYNHLNKELWWPYTYAQIHRLTDFYNRTLQVWAQAKGHRVIPVNERMPWRPELYHDGLHELASGEALHAWIVLQQLMPEIRDDLARHRVPRVGPRPGAGLDTYWKIERTPVVAALNLVTLAPRSVVAETEIPSEIPPARLEPVDDVPGAFTLSKLATASAKAEIVPGVVPVIRTAADPFAYAASVPVETVGLAGKGRVRLRIRVTEGRISIGALNKPAQRFLSQVRVDQNRDLQDITLPIDELADLGSIMISNDRAGETAPSVAELHSVVLQRFR